MEQIVKYSVTDEAINQMKTEYMVLTVSSLDDKEGFEKVHEAKIIVRDHRIAVEKKRVALKADALEYGRKVDAEAKRITALLTPIETYLQTQEDVIIKEKERIRLAKIKAEEERVARIRLMISTIAKEGILEFDETAYQIQSRIDGITGVTIDDIFQEFKDEADQTKGLVLERLNTALTKRQAYEKEQADQEAEKARLEQVAKDQEAERQRQAEAQKAIDEANAKIVAEQKKIQDENDRIAREEQAAKDKKEREEREAKIREESVKNARFESLMQIGFQYPFNDLGTMSDFAYSSMYEEHRKAYDEKKNEEFIAKLKADREEKEAREKKEAEEKKVKEAEEKARLEALKPDRDKLLEYADKIELLPEPGLFNPKPIEIVDRVKASLIRIANQIRKEAREL